MDGLQGLFELSVSEGSALLSVVVSLVDTLLMNDQAAGSQGLRREIVCGQSSEKQIVTEANSIVRKVAEKSIDQEQRRKPITYCSFVVVFVNVVGTYELLLH